MAAMPEGQTPVPVLHADDQGVHVEGHRIAHTAPPAGTVSNVSNRYANYARSIEAAQRIKRITVDQLYERAMVPREVKGKGGARLQTSIRGQIVVPVREGADMSYQMRRFSNWKSLTRLRASETFRRGRLLEQSFDDFNDTGSFNSQSGPNNEFAPLLLTPFHRQMYLTDMLDMMSKMFELKNHNPLAKSAIVNMRNFVLGAGVKLVYENPLCQAEWDAFDERNQVSTLLNMVAIELSTLGETMVRKGFNAQGLPIVKPIDASTCWEIVTNPRDITEIFYYHFQWPTQYQMFTKGQIPSAEYVIEQVPPDQLWHLLVNNAVAEKRGRSDLLPAMTYLKRYKDILNALTVKAQVEASFVWKKKVKGNASDITRLSGDPQFNQDPSVGSNLWENERIDTTPLPSGVAGGATGYKEILDLLTGLVAISLNLPPEFLGVQAHSSRANALIKADPSMKMFVSRQELFRQFIMQLSDWVMSDAIAKGRLPKRQPKKGSEAAATKHMKAGNYEQAMIEIAALHGRGGKALYAEPLNMDMEIIFPDIVEEDRTGYLKDLSLGWANGWISTERAASMFAERMSIRSFEWTEEREKIETEKDQGVGPMPGLTLGEIAATGGEKPGGTASDGGAGAAGAGVTAMKRENLGVPK